MSVGFIGYWLGWCTGFPLWVLGPSGCLDVLRKGSRPRAVDVVRGAWRPLAGFTVWHLSPQLVPRFRLGR